MTLVEPRIDELTRREQLDALRPEWDALVANADTSPFQTWEWISSWCKYGPKHELCVLTARAGDALVGIAPLLVRRLPIPTLAFIGTPGSDYLGFLTMRGQERRLSDRFLDAIVARRARWVLADLREIPEHAPLAELLPEGVAAGRERLQPCPRIELPATWEEYRARLGAQHRKNLAHFRRLAERDLGAAFDTVTGHDVGSAMGELYALHTARWNARRRTGSFATDTQRAFHREIADRFAARGWLRIHRVRARGTTVAILYCYHLGNSVYAYLSGFDLTLAKYSLGTIVTAYAIEDAIGVGAKTFDFMRGGGAHKERWKPCTHYNVRLVLWRSPAWRRAATWLTETVAAARRLTVP